MGSLGHQLAIEQLPHHRAAGIAEDQRDVSVLGHGQLERLKAGQLAAANQAGPVDHRHALLHPHGELAAVGQSHGPRFQFALPLERGRAPLVRRHEREHAIERHAGLKDVLVRQPAVGPDGEIGLDGHPQARAGGGSSAVFGEQRPGDGDLLHVAFAVGIDGKRLLGPLGLGVFHGPLVELPAPDQVDHVLAVASAPGGEVRRSALAAYQPRR